MEDIKKFFFSKKTFIVVLIAVVLAVIFQNTSPQPIPLGAPSWSGITNSSEGIDKGALKRSYPGIIYDESPASTAKINVSQRKIVKNANLSLIVRNLDSAIRSIKATASDLGGFIESLTVSEDGVVILRQDIKENRTRSGYLVVRVPTDKLEAALDRIKAEAIKVSSESVTNQDVTEQFIDLEAQLRNLKREEDGYLKIFDRATKIEDILNISSRLSEVRGRIESLQGQINYLSRTIDMSMISIALTSEADVEVFGVVWSPIAVVKEAIQNMLESVVGYINALIRLVFSLPILILWIATFGGFLFLLFKLFEFLKKVMFNR
ncbi:MAG: DUF4349 domain-containing protein [Patescibacteria group bacterium]